MKRLLFNSISAIVFICVLFLIFVFFKTSFTLSKVSIGGENSDDIPTYLLPELDDLPDKNKDLFNVLLLGQRGEGDPFGGLLTDAMMIISLNRKTEKVVLISLPRDLYVPLPDSRKRDKLNAVYAWGYEREGPGLGISYAKDTISRITGLYIENAAVINFEAFEQLVNAIGGIDVYLENEFIEDKQWWCDESGENCRAFVVPAGENTLDGETTLFYIRSRFSSSDFDRARRQQQVFLAIKKKVMSLGFLANPLNISKLLDILGENVRTDIDLNEIKELLSYLDNHEIDTNNFTNFVFDNSQDGYLYSRFINGQYILLPRSGDFDEVREKCVELVQ